MFVVVVCAPFFERAGAKRVLLAKYTGSEIKLEGEDHVILREDEILALIEG